jgi:hypothetical protein
METKNERPNSEHMVILPLDLLYKILKNLSRWGAIALFDEIIEKAKKLP